MKKIRMIFFIIAIVSILLIFNIETYSTEIGNEVFEGNNNEEVTPPVEQPQEPIEPSEPEQPEPEQPETEEPEPDDPEPEQPDPEEPEETVPEQSKPEPTVPEVPKQPDTPTISQPDSEPEQPEVNTPPQTNESTDSSSNEESTYNPIYEEKKSSNNNLYSLVITDMEIEPEFDKGITEYYLIVDLTIEELEIIAYAEDYRATVDIYNNTELVEGENIVKIIVTAEDGTQKVYRIYVTKTDDAEAANANLNKLQIKGYDIYPEFKNKIYKYNLTINEMITSLEIEVEAENPNATIEIKGNDNLKEGNNIITITVTAEDGITKREYSVNTFISVFNIQVQEENKTPAIIAIIVGLVLILILSIYIISKKT